MKLKKIIWKNGDYGSLIGYVNKYRIFYISYDGISPKSSELDSIKLSTGLPGINKIWRFENYEDAKRTAILILKKYIRDLYTEEEENANCN